MNRDQLKNIVMQHFNLVPAPEIKEEKFATGVLADGTEVSNDKDTPFEIGDSAFVKDAEGAWVQAPEGEHSLDSGITIVVDSEGIITGIHRPDEAGEGSLEEMSEETVTEEVLSEEVEETKLEEHEEAEVSIEEVVKAVIEEVVAPQIEELKAELGSYKEKMAEVAAQPATETITQKQFSATPEDYKEMPHADAIARAVQAFKNKPRA